MLITQKRLGETLSELIDRLRKEQNIPKHTPITYAGRLDPMAEGVMILLIGSEVKQKQQYTSLSKTYRFKVLFGVSTDTYDVLGRITNIKTPRTIKVSKINQILPYIKNIKQHKYPPYSSKTVQGKPLWLWAKQGRINEIDIPTKDIKILDITLEATDIKPLTSVIKPKLSIIQNLKGDFRQHEILQDWNNTLQQHGNKLITISTITATVSSGTYIRSISQIIGDKLNTPTLTLHINRTAIHKTQRVGR